MEISCEFTGGLELLFDGIKHKKVTLKENSKITSLFHSLASNMSLHSKELFLKDNFIRPGILVLINEVDWELEGEHDYTLVDGDSIVMISTLHGG